MRKDVQLKAVLRRARKLYLEDFKAKTSYINMKSREVRKAKKSKANCIFFETCLKTYGRDTFENEFSIHNVVRNSKIENEFFLCLGAIIKKHEMLSLLTMPESSFYISNPNELKKKVDFVEKIYKVFNKFSGRLLQELFKIQSMKVIFNSFSTQFAAEDWTKDEKTGLRVILGYCESSKK